METIVKKRVERLILFNTEEQKSEAWIKKRHNMITASDIATVLDINPFMTKKQLLVRKCNPIEFEANEFTLWGDLFETIARDIYQKMCLVENVHETGCIPHRKYKWLGASPDGILPNGKLLEIKCPKKRKIHDENYPYMYWIQMQIQMECCNLNECDFFHCQFYQYANKDEYISDVATTNKGYIKSKNIYWKLERFSLKTIQRDSRWFIKNVGQLQQFWKTVLHYRNVGIDKLNMEDIQVKNITDWSKWIAATQVKNYLLNDTCLDYIDILHGLKKNDIYIEPLQHENKKKLQEYLDEHINYGSSFIEMICNQGLVFERNVIELLNKRIPIKMVTTEDSQARSVVQFKQTIKFMKQGVPIIYHGVLHDHENKLYGIPDLLVRSDYVNQLTDGDYIKNPNIKSIFSKDYHYIVVDIKFSTLKLASDGIHMINDGIVKASKGQLFIYNQILGSLQGHKPECAYVLGKKWRYKKNSQLFSGNGCFDRLGVINFADRDFEYAEKVQLALDWCKEVRENFNQFTLFPPNDPRLFPNMCNKYDHPNHNIKYKLSKEIKEITSLWYCNTKNREAAFEKGVYKWDDNKCTAEILGITGEWKQPRVQAILEINQQKDDLIRCYNFQNTNNWTIFGELEIFVDYETANIHKSDSNDGSVCSEDESIITIIGCGYAKNGKWIFKKFTVDQITHKEEIKIVSEFYDYVQLLTKTHKTTNPRIFHWGHIERTIYNKLRSKTKMWGDLNWFDLCKTIQTEIIVFKDALSYGLKEVANALYKHKLLNTSWKNHSKCLDGLNAMVSMMECNDIAVKNNVSLTNMSIMKDIEKYNEVDCKVMWEIIEVLRNEFSNYATIPGPYTIDNVEVIDLVGSSLD